MRGSTKERMALCEDGAMRPWPEAAAFIGVRRTKIYELMNSGALKYSRLPGGDRRVAKRALIALLADGLVEREH